MADRSESGPKWGSTAVGGYLRLGLAEVRAIAPHADATIAQPANYAMPGVATPGEVTEARRDDVEHEESVIDSRINQIGPPRDDHDRGREDRGMERE